MRRGFLVLLALACGGCSAPAPTPTPSTQVVARVGNTTITDGVFQVRLRSVLTSVAQAGGPSANPAMRSQVRASVLRSLIIDTVIGQEAATLGVAATAAEIQAQVNAAAAAAGGSGKLESQLAALGGSMTQLNDEIVSSLDEQKLEDAFARQRAAEIEQKLAAGAGFAMLASQYSDDATTASKGGDLGSVPRAQVQGDDPAYAGPVLTLSTGAHTDPPIRDARGYDIVELESATPSALTLRHIIVDAPQPYTVKERPRWFSEAIFESLAMDCTAGRIHVYISDVGDDVCAAASATASPGGSTAPTASAVPSP